MAADDTDDDSDPCFCAALDSLLRQHDGLDSKGNVAARCLSFVQCVNGSSGTPTNQNIALDSGSTLHMRRHKHAFKTDSCIKCHNSFVRTGNITEIPVEGHGTSGIKVDGNTNVISMSIEPRVIQ